MQKKLFDQFPPVTTKEWMERINADLKGADFNKSLVWRTGEAYRCYAFLSPGKSGNIKHPDAFLPLFLKGYVREPADGGVQATSNNWLVKQNIKVSDYSAANKKALEILMKGVNSLGFTPGDPESVNEKNWRG